MATAAVADAKVALHAPLASPEEAVDMQVEAAGPSEGEDEDLYTALKTLQRQLEFLEIQARSDLHPPAPITLLLSAIVSG
jgi:hypothetical protein